ncbi:MAG: cupin domain-containing protein [Armatimonadia bacterium]|nr:cupin domain-containing protein [Armatimonadia bacterium]
MTYHVLDKQAAERKTIHEDWGSLTWLAGRAHGNSESLTVGRVVIKPGRSNPRHSHPTCDEVLYLLSGTLEHTIGGDKVTLQAGDTISITGGVNHNATNVGETDADMIVTFSSADRTVELE